MFRGVIKSTKFCKVDFALRLKSPPPLIDNAKNVKWVLNTKNAKYDSPLLKYSMNILTVTYLWRL